MPREYPSPDREVRQENRTERREQALQSHPALTEAQQNRAQDILNNAQLPHDEFFTPKWRDEHPHAVYAGWGYYSPYANASWGTVSGWLGYPVNMAYSGAGQSVSYEYGDDVVVYSEPVVEISEPAGEINVSSAQAAAPESSKPAVTELTSENDQINKTSGSASATETKWLSLGTFALNREKNAQSRYYIQLVVDKEGTIAGTFYDSAKDATELISGTVDRQSLQASWTVGKRDKPVMEASIQNLTKDSTPVTVRLDLGVTQTWQLVRLEAPKLN